MTQIRTVSMISITLALAACGSKKDDGQAPVAPSPKPGTPAPAPGPSNTAPSPGPTAPAPEPGTTAPAQAPAPAPKQVSIIAVAEGAGCPPEMHKVADVPIKLDGNTLSFTRGRGGGCPTRPVYTAVYTRANPMPVLVCYDVGADTCEMDIMAEPISIDLAAALQDAGATSAVLAK